PVGRLCRSAGASGRRATQRMRARDGNARRSKGIVMKRTTAVASGLLLLCITFCVAGWAVNDGSNPEIDQTETARSTDSQSAPVTASDQLPRVVGFGHVDVEGGTVPLTVPNIGQIEHVLVKEG